MNSGGALLYDIFERILESSWQGLFIVLLILIVQALFRRRLSATWNFAIWAALMVRLVAVWQVPSPISLSEGIPATWQAANKAFRGATPTDILPDELQSSAPDPVSLQEKVVPTLNVGTPSIAWRVAAYVWALGAVSSFIFFLANGYIYGHRVRRDHVVPGAAAQQLFEECKRRVGVRGSISAIASPNIAVPALFGAIRPCVLLPLEILRTEHRERLRYMFLHELAHVKRRDVAFGWILYSLLCLHWFNPLLWWVARRILTDRELACDAHVLSLLDPLDRHSYGTALLDQLKVSQDTTLSPYAAGITERKSNIKRRITMLTTYRRSSLWGHMLALGLCAVMVIVAIAGAETPQRSSMATVSADRIFAFVAPNGGTMLAATIKNSGATDVEASVTFYEGKPGPYEKKIGDGVLLVPANGEATETVMWVVRPQRYAVFAVVKATSATESHTTYQTIICKKQDNQTMFAYLPRTTPSTEASKQPANLRAATYDLKRVLSESGFMRADLETLTKRKNEAQASLDTETKKIMDEMKRLNDDKSLSDDLRQARQDEIRDALRDLRSQGDDMRTEIEEASNKYFAKLRAAIAAEAAPIATRLGLDVVVESKGHSVLWTRDAIAIDQPEALSGDDISDQLIEVLKKKAA